MDEATQKKIRDLNLKIAKLEKELVQTQHTLGLQSWLKAGHAGQLSRTAQKDRLRIEEKIGDLKSQLNALEPKPETSPQENAAPKKRAAKKKT
jgi:hypothetical protein